MRILFVHQNFPGQFKHLAPALVARGDEVVALRMNPQTPVPGVRTLTSQGRCETGNGHPWSRDFDTKVIRGEATLRTAIALRDEGFVPAVILAHPGWGEAMFLKTVWPDVPLTLYCEFYYAARGADLGFDPEFPSTEHPKADEAKTMLRNVPQTMLLGDVAGAICPTGFQASTYPDSFQSRIAVIHDGINTQAITLGAGTAIKLSSGETIGPDDEVITFVSRQLEPYRGFHRFMRALPELQRRRPKARIMIIGGDSVGYGAAAPEGKTWRQVMLQEVGHDLDLSRIHFVGQIAYAAFINLLRLSSLHVYLTYPFVASWSLLETMAAGTPVIASDTAPVREFVRHGETGMLFDFFDTHALVEQACAVLSDPALAARLTTAARAMVEDHYDLQNVCLPRQIEWLDGVAAGQSQ